jgi:hypothetical protein
MRIEPVENFLYEALEIGFSVARGASFGTKG